MRRKRGVWWALLTLGVLLLLGVFLWWFQTFTLTVTRVELAHPAVKAPVKIVQLTDLHGASFGRENHSLLEKIEREQPDLIAVTGDLYTHGDEAGKQTAIHLLTELVKLCPVYAVPGEHDASAEFLDALRGVGVRVLDYKTESLRVGETPLRLYGIDNVYYSATFSLENEFSPPDEQEFSILLAHISNPPAFAAFGVDLALCGDTHGGQVRLPWIGPIYYQGSWFPVFSYSHGIYDKGMYQLEDMHLFISSGLGNYPAPVRFWNRPEIVVLTLLPST